MTSTLLCVPSNCEQEKYKSSSMTCIYVTELCHCVQSVNGSSHFLITVLLTRLVILQDEGDKRVVLLLFAQCLIDYYPKTLRRTSNEVVFVRGYT